MPKARTRAGLTTGSLTERASFRFAGQIMVPRREGISKVKGRRSRTGAIRADRGMPRVWARPTGWRAAWEFSLRCSWAAFPGSAKAKPWPFLRPVPAWNRAAYFMGAPRYLADTPILVRVWGAPQYDSLVVGTFRADVPPELA